MTTSMTTSLADQLSCYTGSLVSYLGPGSERRLAEAVRLAVRKPAAGSPLAFSHHSRIDPSPRGELAYASAPSWRRARAALATTPGTVIVVADCASLPWSPASEAEAAPHWITVSGGPSGGWWVQDPFDALMPYGEHRPYRGLVSDDELRSLMAPRPGTERVALRDAFALGAEIACPPPTMYRWLHRVPRAADGGEQPGRGSWITGTGAALRYLADLFADDAQLLAECLEDLWAASRHHILRDRTLRTLGLLDPAAADARTDLWAALPQALRFAAESARRGRPRPALVRTTLHRLAEAELHRLAEAEQPRLAGAEDPRPAHLEALNV